MLIITVDNRTERRTAKKAKVVYWDQQLFFLLSEFFTVMADLILGFLSPPGFEPRLLSVRAQWRFSLYINTINSVIYAVMTKRDSSVMGLQSHESC